MKKKITKGKIFDIISWIVVLLLFGSSLFLLISRQSNGSVLIFGNRYDVVLSNSMSYKNEAHLDFLNGHDDQIQKMDVVQSRAVDKNSEINVYDIVLFRDKTIGTNMHRVVDKQVKNIDYFYLKDAAITNEEISLNQYGSKIYTSTNLHFTTLELTFVSSNASFSNGYNVSLNTHLYLDLTVETKQVADKYEHKLTAKKSTDAPGKLIIGHNKEFDYGSEVITSIKLDSTYGDININGSNFELIDGIYTSINNITYEYMIRGDAAKTEDGWFTIDQIYSKVTKIIPKAGYFVSYITSVPGIIMLVGIGLLIVVADVGLDLIAKKEKEKKKLRVYFSTKWESCSCELKGDNSSENQEATLIGQDRYGENIYKVIVDNKIFKEIKFSNGDNSTDFISLEGINSGTGFYESEEGIKTFVQEENNEAKNKKK